MPASRGFETAVVGRICGKLRRLVHNLASLLYLAPLSKVMNKIGIGIRKEAIKPAAGPGRMKGQ